MASWIGGIGEKEQAMRSTLTHFLVISILTALFSPATAVLAQSVAVKSAKSDAALGTPDAQRLTGTDVEKLSLQGLIKDALEANPEIKYMARRFDAARERVPQEKALPDPTLSYGYAGNINPIPPFDIQKGDPSSARMLNFTQEVPFPGKRSLKGKMATMAAESERWAYEQARLDLVAQVKDSYFDYYYFTKAVDVITKNKELVEKFEKIAEAQYAVGKGIQQDVLKAQVEVSKLIDQLTTLEQRKETAKARLNSLLYRDPDSPLREPEDIKPTDFPYTLGDLKEMALANYPTIKMERRKIDGAQYGVQLAQKEFYPDFSVAFTYFNRPGLPDMYGVNVGVKIPLYFWQKQRPALAEAVTNQEAEQRRLESITTLLFFTIKDKYLSETTAERLVKLYGTTIVPQSSLSLESAIAGYEVGKVDFLTLLDSLVTLRGYELSYYEQLSNAEKAVSALEALVGRTLRP
ncbi:MAG TPA: TolC family protein [Blastocatellia bacterium]|nr:TolC family protein [Blastocatellia bacterium]